jgi:2-hydroxy-3-keto-5-methylthiopentenyl-1-phosphate phosphatase
MEIKTTEEAKTNVINCAKELTSLLKQKKEIDDEIKAIKQKFKEEGVPVQIVSKQINAVKADKKKTASEKFEGETIKDWIEADGDVSNAIDELI